MKKKISFFIRAYNDLDCRMPLILSFAGDSRFEVSLISYPTNNGFYNIENYENFQLIKKNNNIKLINSMLYKNNNIIFLFLYYLNHFLQNFLFKKINFSKSNKIFFHFFRYFEKSLITYNKKNFQLLKSVIKNSTIILDDIILDMNRSDFLSKILELKLHRKIISIQTGQDTYIDLNRSKKSNLIKRKELIVDKFLVPSINDKRVFKSLNIKNNISVVGNTRFEKNWIRKLNTKSKRLKINNLKNNIVFMLSKIEYGVDVSKLIRTIESFAKIKNTLIIIKPHTRGMNIDSIIRKLKYPNILNGLYMDSSSLIKWSNIVCFTGSSIIFQAMILGKKCIFLKNCLNSKSIFDKSSAVIKINHYKEVDDSIHIKNSKKYIDSFLKRHLYNNKNGRENIIQIKKYCA
jgi:hypothetical protein